MAIKQLVIAPSFPYNTHTFVTREVASTLERGHDVTVLAPTTGDAAGQALADALGVPRNRIVYINVQSSPAFSLDVCRFKKSIRRAARRERYGRMLAERRKTFFCRVCREIDARSPPDLIHAHFLSFAFNVAMPLSDILGVPFTLIAHDANLPDYPAEVLSELQSHAAQVFLVSPEYLRIWAEKTGSSERLIVLPNAVDLNEFVANGKPLERSPSVVISSVCRLVPEKRVADGIVAVKRLLDKGLDCRYEVVGDGTERAALTRTVRELSLDGRVTFHGTLPHHRVVGLLASSDILLHPSELESFGIAIVEGMASHLPVVAARSGGAIGIVDHGCTGYLYKPGDINTMVERLGELVESSERRVEMGAAGRERVESVFTWGARMDVLEAAWRRIASESQDC